MWLVYLINRDNFYELSAQLDMYIHILAQALDGGKRKSKKNENENNSFYFKIKL